MDNRKSDGSNGYRASSYLHYLPSIYQEDAFVGRFLLIFEDILSPIQQVVNTLPERFDPRLSPSPMLELLASWVGADRPEGMSEPRWRKLIGAFLFLHRWRGTKIGLRTALEIATGKRPLITEYAPGLVVSQDATLGLNTALVTGHPLRVRISFDCPPEDVDRVVVDDIIRLYKPAHSSYSVDFLTPAAE